MQAIYPSHSLGATKLANHDNCVGKVVDAFVASCNCKTGCTTNFEKSINTCNDMCQCSQCSICKDGLADINKLLGDKGILKCLL